MQAAGRLPERIALDVEDDVAASPPLVADFAELAERAVLDRVWLRRVALGERRHEATAHPAIVGRVVVAAQRSTLADSQQDVHGLGRHALDGLDGFAVETELEHVRRLLGPRQLGVDRLVTPGAERRQTLDSLQEIRAASPVAPNEGRLVDDLDAGAHGLDGRSCPGLEVPNVSGPDVDDLAAFAPQVREIGGLVLLALAAEQLAVLVGDMRPRALPARDLARKGRQVLALDVVVRIGGGEKEAISEELQKLFGRSSARTWGALPR